MCGVEGMRWGASPSIGEEGVCVCGVEGMRWGASPSTGEEGVCVCGGEGMRWGRHCQLVRRVCVCVVGRE